MNPPTNRRPWAMPAFAGLLIALGVALGIANAQEQGKTSYTKLDITEPFTSIMARMKEAGDRETAGRSPERALRPERSASAWCHDGARQAAAIILVDRSKRKDVILAVLNMAN